MLHKILMILTIFTISFILVITANAQDIKPDGGTNYDIWHPDANVNIRWNIDDFNNTDNLQLIIWNGNTGEEFLIDESISPADNSYIWNIPEDFPTGSKFRIILRQSGISIANKNFITVFPNLFYKMKPLDLETNLVTDDLLLFPNPTQDILYFDSDKLPDKIAIINQSGINEKIFNSVTNNFIYVDNLSNGVYYMLSYYTGGYSVNKFIISR